MADPLTSLLQKKKEDVKPAQPKAASPIGIPQVAAPTSLFDVESSLGSRAPTTGIGGSLPGEETVGELIHKALAPGSNVDFPMITDICERLTKMPREAAEAVRCLHNACAEQQGPPRRKLKALTIMHEVMYDPLAAAELREVYGAREVLQKLQGTHSTGLGDSADEQIRMFATEVEKTCFCSSPSHSSPSLVSELPSRPTDILGSEATMGIPASPMSTTSFAPQARQRKRDQAMDKLWQFGSAVGANLATNLAAAQEVAKTKMAEGGMASLLQTGAQGNQSRVEIPKFQPNPEAQRPVLSISFDGLLAGEKVHYAVHNAYLLISNPLCETKGRLLVTNYRLKFQTQKGSLREDMSWILDKQLLDVPMGAIEEIKLVNNLSETGAQEWKIRIITKDFRTISLLMPEAQDLSMVEEAVAAIGQPGHVFISSLFAFRHAEEIWASGVAKNGEGWNLYDPCAEYSRMGVDTPKVPVASSPWSLCDLNRDYKLCDTYPIWLVRPRKITDQDLYAVANFRKRHRLPTMSWCGGPRLGFASLWRSSQPTEGILGKACYEDQKLVSSIQEGTAAGTDRPLLVMDLRKWKAAYANKVGGGGFEAYPGCRVVFGGIDNIHGVRDAWRGMGQAVANLNKHEVGTWFKDVANSGWYDVLGAMMNCVIGVIRELELHRCSALIHCSDGWDRTAQISSLVMLCMDPYYRTVSGFLLLIQKEFCSFGHCFQTRLANGEKSSNEFCPVFLQWLECVWQLTVQFPTAFEFTETLLLFIGKEALSNRYGTFLTNSEKERTEKVAPYTLSLWSAILEAGPAPEHMNYQYQSREETLQPSITQINFKVWKAYWFRYCVHP